MSRFSSSFSATFLRLSLKELMGLPRRLKTAWYAALRALVMVPLAESPSVMKMLLRSMSSVVLSVRLSP